MEGAIENSCYWSSCWFGNRASKSRFLFSHYSDFQTSPVNDFLLTSYLSLFLVMERSSLNRHFYIFHHWRFLILCSSSFLYYRSSLEPKGSGNPQTRDLPTVPWFLGPSVTLYSLVLWRAHRFLNRQEATMKTSSPENPHVVTIEPTSGPKCNHLWTAYQGFYELL